MPAKSIRNLLGRAKPPPALAEALAELEQLANERATLAGPARLLRDVLPELDAESHLTNVPVLTAEQARAKLQQGIPLLRGQKLALDRDASRRRWQRVCAVAQRYHDGAAAHAIWKAIRRGELDPQQLADAALAGHGQAIFTRANELGLDASLTGTLLRLTLFPLLSATNQELATLDVPLAWEQGYCPTCGSWPLLGEFRGLEQTRHLRCGLCAAAWEFPRLRCPYCGASDHRQLGYFFVEAEEGKYRAATCDICRGYVKMISCLSELSWPRLLVADVATLHLDLAAAERGYVQNPPTATAPEKI